MFHVEHLYHCGTMYTRSTTTRNRGKDMNTAVITEGYSRTNPKYVVCVRAWFDKVNGNSYFTARIWGGDEIKTIPFTYGHGDGTYLEYACMELGLARDAWNTGDWEHRASLFGVEVTEVMRRKDLHKASRQ